MSASVWEPGSNIINIDAESTNLSQVFSATAAQVTFTLTLFTYTVGAASIAVYRGGQRLIKGVDWSEVDSTHFSITGISLDAGEVIECVAVLGASSANSLASAASAAAASASQVAAGISETNAAASASAATFPWAPESGGIYYAGGSVRIGAAGARITGDFSNATIANRVLFQTSTSGGNTSFGLLPHPLNATPITTFEACLSSDPAITSVLQCQITQTDARLNSGSRGGASYLPMTFYTGGSERMRIDTSGNLLMATTGARITGDFSNATVANRVIFQTSTVNGITSVGAIPNGTSVVAVVKAFGASDPTNAPSISISQLGATESRLSAEANGSSGYTPLTFYTGGSERMRIGVSGQLGIGGATYGTAGQVLTSGGPSAAPTWSNAISPSYFTTPSVISNSNVQNMAHGLGAKPNHITINLLVTTANNGWSVGDLISGSGISVSGTANTVIQVGADATNIIVGCGTGSLVVLNKTTGAFAAVAVGNFKVYVGVSL